MITTMLFWLPIAMVATGTLWLAIRQVKDGNAAAAMGGKTLVTAEKTLALLAEGAARDGNDKLRAELIETRTKLALAGAQGSTNTVKAIIDQLPQLTDNQRRLDEEKKNSVVSMAIDFDLSWTALVRLALEKFYGRVEDMRINGIQLDHVNRETRLPPLTTVGNQNTIYRIGEVVDKGSRAFILVEYTPGALSPNGMSRAVLSFDVLSKAGLDTRFRIEMDFNDVATQFGSDPKPKDGIPTDSMKKKLDDGFARAIERFLVISAVAN